ncbi:MAG TPA: hypothetical protein VGR14_09065 [Verrucomicrobiae bacterium]|jgi:hypothetical protein|nr:hypothetical protein [Verrucomicrobiae bacterium]
MKISCIAAVALAMTTFGTLQARAGGWAIAGGVVGGLAVGTAIGASVAASGPVYYTAPAPVYAAPRYYAPAAVAVGPAYCYGPRVAYGAPYPYYHPYFRAGYGWGPHYNYHGGHYFRR